MSKTTDYVLENTNKLQIYPEVTGGDHGFSMFNDAGTEVEVSEFLYSLVRMLKPNYILETGTHVGVSSAYMALALEENKKGSMTTFEILPELRVKAVALWDDLNISGLIESHLYSSLLGPLPVQPIDFLFLDSEPQLRFDEFIRYWPLVPLGGFIAIHDLHPKMGHEDWVVHDMYDWPWGDFRTKLGQYIKNGEVSIMHFPTPRGFTFFQKVDPNKFEYVKYLRS